MGDAAYPDDWGGWLHEAETRIVECIPQAWRHRQACPEASMRQAFRRVRAATRGAHCRPLDPRLAIFSVPQGDPEEKM